MTLWSAADALSLELLNSPHVETFRSGLHPTRVKPGTVPPLGPERVGDLFAYFGGLRGQPLLLAKRAIRTPPFAEISAKPETQAWFASAERVAFAFVETIEFLRSRLPGYPNIRALELLPGAPRVHHDGFWDQRFPWELEVRQAQLHRTSRPRLLALALEFPDQGRAAYEALVDIHRALSDTAAWRDFATAHRELDATARAELVGLRGEARDALDDVVVEAVASANGMRAAAYRRAELERIRSKATTAGLIRYWEAFDRIDELVDTIAALISHRVAFDGFSSLRPREADWAEPGELRTVRFVANDSELIRHLPDFVRLEVSASGLGGLVMMTSLQSKWNREGSVTLSATGRLLVGSADRPAALSFAGRPLP